MWIKVIAIVVLGCGLILDIVNAIWVIQSRKKRTPSPVVLVPIVPYLLAIILLKISGISWLCFAILLLLMIFIHVFSIFILPWLGIMTMNIKRHRGIFDMTFLEEQEKNE